MGWETRRGRRYYYRYRRVNGRKVREYFGCGPEAEDAARKDAEEAMRRATRRVECAKTAVELAELMLLFDMIDAECDAQVIPAMAALGFHKYRGVWRKKRKPREEA